MTRLRNKYLFSTVLALGCISLTLGTVGVVASESLFEASKFGERLAQSLADPNVAAFAGDLLTDAVVKASPDLIAARPLIQATANGMVATRPFRVLVGNAGERAHQALFSKGAQNVVLSLPDVAVLMNGALSHGSPALAARIPKSLETAITSLGEGHQTEWLVNAWKLGQRLRWVARGLLTLGPLLLALSILLAPDRRLGFLRVGIGLALCGALVMAVVPLGRLAFTLLLNSPVESRVAAGLWRTFMVETNAWGLMLAGFGVLLGAGAVSLLESINPTDWVRAVNQWITRPPLTYTGRLLWSVSLLAAGSIAILFPRDAVAAAGVLAGGFASFFGIRELFRLLLERVDHSHAVERLTNERRWAVHVVLVLLVTLLLGGAWFAWRHPSIQKKPVLTSACNGSVELCDRPLNEVVFPGAHNAMSNQEIPGWLFPHHEHVIARQLRDGIRALLIDVHYGFPGGERIKTDMDSEPNKEKMVTVLGQEGYDAAMRIRGRLVGVKEGQRGVYLCHGFCELGAYQLAPTLTDIRSFLIENPDEVVLIIFEDYVTPQDLAAIFDASLLTQFVYHGSTDAGWPTLRTLIESGQRLVVFLESGRPGVPWLRPAFTSFQETPYSFRTVQQMSCVANRGGTAAPLFLINNWIETTPTPRPSNAAVVNAHDFLLKRALDCAAEREHIPNIVAVDFYATGDVVGVARQLNSLGPRLVQTARSLQSAPQVPASH